MASALGDEDLWCADDLTSDVRTASGRTALAQAIYRRWTTDRGALLDDPNYGTNLVDYINDDVSSGDLGVILSVALAEAKKDERVVDITGTVELLSTGVLMLSFEVTDGEGPFVLTISVNDVSVELLDLPVAA